MIFSILLYFPNKNLDTQAEFHLSLKSILAQKNPKWKLVILGNADQLGIANAVISAIKQTQDIVNQINLIQVKTYGSLNLNQSFDYLGSDLNDESNKLLMLQCGDYFSTEFLSKSEDFLKALDLDKNDFSPILALSDFKYIDSKQQIFSSEFVLKSKIETKTYMDFIFNPKLLVKPIQFYWDIKLIKEFEIVFDEGIENFDIKLAKFNLDYILALTKINDFITPSLKVCPDSYYICSNQVINQNLIDHNQSWWNILTDKSDQLKLIGGKTWWWYNWLKIWRG